MGDFEVSVSAGTESSVKYHSVSVYVLTCRVKRGGDSVWWVVLVGRYPSGYEIFSYPESVAPPGV